jgi:hypothetical protein
MITIETLKEFIGDGGKATHGHIVAIVEQKMLKRGNPLKDAEITKQVSYIALLNANYQNVVNNALVREGKEAEFVSKENWFTPEYDSFNGSIVAKKSDTNCKYLKMIVKSAITHNFFINGVVATKEQIEIIKQFRQKSSPASNQNLDNEVIVRTIKTENIVRIKKGGVELETELKRYVQL